MSGNHEPARGPCAVRRAQPRRPPLAIKVSHPLPSSLAIKVSHPLPSSLAIKVSHPLPSSLAIKVSHSRHRPPQTKTRRSLHSGGRACTPSSCTSTTWRTAGTRAFPSSTSPFDHARDRQQQWHSPLHTLPRPASEREWVYCTNAPRAQACQTTPYDPACRRCCGLLSSTTTPTCATTGLTTSRLRWARASSTRPTTGCTCNGRPHSKPRRLCSAPEWVAEPWLVAGGGRGRWRVLALALMQHGYPRCAGTTSRIRWRVAVRIRKSTATGTEQRSYSQDRRAAASPHLCDKAHGA